MVRKEPKTTSPTSDGAKGNSSAFTLIEVLLVCVLIGVLVSVSLPKLGGTSRNLRFNQTLEDLERSIRFARAEAVRRKLKVRFEVERGGREYRLSLQEVQVTFREDYGSFGDTFLDQDHILPDGVQIEKIKGNANAEEIRQIAFTPDGVSSPYKVHLRDNHDRKGMIEIGPWYDQVSARRVKTKDEPISQSSSNQAEAQEGSNSI